jgi:hypothetical protein
VERADTRSRTPAGISISGTNVVETTRVGMIRPLSSASDLLAIASAGWTPREGQTDVELQPTAVEAPAEGVRIATRVLDVANDVPIPNALLMVLKPGIDGNSIELRASHRAASMRLVASRTSSRGRGSSRIAA